MSRDYKLYLEDALEAVKKIEMFTAGLSASSFKSDPKTFDAVLRNMEVLGEAFKKIPEDVRKKYPDIEWRKITGLRDMLIHEYFGVDEGIIWDIVATKVSKLKTQIERMLAV